METYFIFLTNAHCNIQMIHTDKLCNHIFCLWKTILFSNLCKEKTSLYNWLPQHGGRADASSSIRGGINVCVLIYTAGLSLTTISRRSRFVLYVSVCLNPIKVNWGHVSNFRIRTSIALAIAWVPSIVMVLTILSVDDLSKVFGVNLQGPGEWHFVAGLL